jgi:hypothetical protein
MVFRYNDINIVESFFQQMNDKIEENSEILSNTYLNDHEIHKGILDAYGKSLPYLKKFNKILIDNSNLKIEITDFNLTIFTLCGLSNLLLVDAKYLIDNELVKSEYEKELKSVLEELRLNGIGNNLVKNLYEIFNSLVNVYYNLNVEKNVYKCLTDINFIKSINNFCIENDINFENFSYNVDRLKQTIEYYIKSGKEKKIIKKANYKVLKLNEFN